MSKVLPSLCGLRSWAVVWLLLVAASAQAQWTTVTARQVTDGSASGNLLVAGSIFFQAVDANQQPVGFKLGGGGQVILKAFCGTITNGVITGPCKGTGAFRVPDAALTAPVVAYQITVQSGFATVRTDVTSGGPWGGLTGTLSNQADLAAALNARVLTTTTINGHALSGNLTLQLSDLGLPAESDGYVIYGAGGAWGKNNAPAFSAANLTNFPTFNQSTTGTAAKATALAASPGQCGSNLATGITAAGDANCDSRITDDGAQLTYSGPGGVQAKALGLTNAYNVSTLPACAAGTLLQQAAVTDATVATPGSNYVGGGTYTIRVECIFNASGSHYQWIID